VHDNRGEGDVGDPHLGLGEGVIDVPAVVAAARGKGASVVLEHDSESAVLTSLAYLRRLGLLEGSPRRAGLSPPAPR
jgi:sugar phosphate isomerase/epimerase